MVSPAQRREGVTWAQRAYRVSERRAVEIFGVARSSVRYKSCRAPRDPLRHRIREIAGVRISFGYRQIHTLLRREGWSVNHKLTYRLYREEGLTLRRKRPKRRRSAAHREQRVPTTRPNERWAMDFVHDTLSGGQTIRVLAVIDVHTRECVVLRAGRGFKGEDVAGALSEAGARASALPTLISVDNGTEFTSKSLDHWAYWNRVQLDFSRPGKPTDNAHVEAFNSVLRRECLSQHWFIDLEDAQSVLDRWRADYNNFRPHGSLGRLTPTDFAAGALQPPALGRLVNSQS
jgi:putative transposase